MKWQQEQNWHGCIFTLLLIGYRNRNRNKKFAIARITYKNIRALQEFAIELKTSKTTN